MSEFLRFTDLCSYSKQCEDLKTSVSEFSERLRAKTKEYDSLLAQLTETKGQLAMAELHIQQVS